MSLLKGFTSLFDWIFPKTLDDSMQELYTKMSWGKYSAYPTASAFNMAVDITSTQEPPPQTIYASKETMNQLLLDMNKNMSSDIKLTKDQEFAIWWLYDREAGRFPNKDTIIVNGINITEVVKDLLQNRLFI
jgi:hypothetical protein